MKKHMMITLVVAAMLLLPLSAAFSADVFLTKTELIQWDPDKAYDGYNLFNVNGVGTYLIDMEGRVVNSWFGMDAKPGMYSFLMENGNLRVECSPSYVPASPLQAGGSQGRIEEYDWAGNRVWFMDVFDGWTETAGVRTQGDGTTATIRQHHDFQRMYNTALGKWTYMALCWVAKNEADADNMGVEDQYNGGSRLVDNTRTTQDESTMDLATWSPDALIEILPDYESGEGGQIVWYWTFADHMLTTDADGTGAAMRAADSGNEFYTDWAGRISRRPLITDTAGIAANPQLLDVHGMHYTVPDGPRVDYQHCNSFDYDENTGYVAINAKAANEFFVVDHDGTFITSAAPGTAANGYDTNAVGATARTDAGNFLYRFGNRANYGQGEPAGFYDEGDMEMYGTHDIQFILDYHWRAPRTGDTWAAPTAAFALPGANNFLFFDNGCYNSLNAGSRSIEVNPYEDGGTATSAASGFQLAGTSGFIDPADLPRDAQRVWYFGGGGNVNGINDFYSSYISSTQRLPNGNTVVCSGSMSHFFEVTNNPKQVVWEYVMPPINRTTGLFTTTKQEANMCFRFHRFAADHPALAGRDLTPGDTLTGALPIGLAEALDGGASPAPAVVPPAPTGWGTSGLSVSEGGGGSAGGASSGGGSAY